MFFYFRLLCFFYSWQLWMYRSEVLTAESLCDSAASKQRLSAEEGGRYRRHHPPVAYNTIYSYPSLWAGQYPCVEYHPEDHGILYTAM